MPYELERRSFLGAAAGFSIVPRHVLGGANHVAPSDKISLAYIGLGTQGIRELLPMLLSDDIQVTAVCDPNKNSTDYVDWSKDSLRGDVRKFLDNPAWRAGEEGIPGGREVGREIVETWYASKRAPAGYKGCATYADFRELLEKEKDLDAVKIMTPDHLHAAIAIAAMKKGKHVLLHKPIANRVDEARKVLAVRAEAKVATHFIPWDARGSVDRVMAWIQGGEIGTLREIHNWSNRPVWPQYLTLPADRPPVPKDFDWDLWLGPERDRPYHPNYTHAVFRGWYDFGGGPIADMGHYSLWVVFRALKLGVPTVIEATPSTACAITGQVSRKIRNDFSFPQASTIRFRFPAREGFGPVDLWWHDGGMKPPAPDEVEAANQELPPEGMMFVGDKGRILAGFLIEDPFILTERGLRERAAKPPERPARSERSEVPPGLLEFIAACRGTKPSSADFSHAAGIAETFNLGAIALRMGGRRLQYDAAGMQFTNVAAANKYLYRDYRPGWEL